MREDILENRLTPEKQTDGMISAYYGLDYDTVSRPMVKEYMKQVRELLRYSSALDRNEAQDRYNCMNIWSFMGKEHVSVHDWSWCRYMFEPLTKVMYMREK